MASAIKNYVNHLEDQINESLESNVLELITSDNLKPRGFCHSLFARTVSAIKFTKNNPNHQLSKRQVKEKLSRILKREENMMKERAESCAAEYTVDQLVYCSDSARFDLRDGIFIAKRRSITDHFQKYFSKVNNDCSSPIYKNILKIIKKGFKPVIRDSLYSEYDYLENKYHYSYGKEDSAKIKDRMLEVAKDLDDNNVFDRYYRLPLPASKEEMLSKIQKRKASCFDIDLTHYYNSPNGDQGEVGACFGFGAAGLLNNALATNNINPLYLYILAIEKKVFPTYIPVYHDIKNTYEKTNITDMGGLSSSIAREAFKMKNYCSLDDLFNPWKKVTMTWEK